MHYVGLREGQKDYMGQGAGSPTRGRRAHVGCEDFIFRFVPRWLKVPLIVYEFEHRAEEETTRKTRKFYYGGILEVSSHWKACWGKAMQYALRNYIVSLLNYFFFFFKPGEYVRKQKKKHEKKYR